MFNLLQSIVKENTQMIGKKTLMLLGDFVKEFEVMGLFQGLHWAGHTVHAVCSDKKAEDTARPALYDFEGDQTYSKKQVTSLV